MKKVTKKPEANAEATTPATVKPPKAKEIVAISTGKETKVTVAEDGACTVVIAKSEATALKDGWALAKRGAESCVRVGQALARIGVASGLSNRQVVKIASQFVGEAVGSKAESTLLRWLTLWHRSKLAINAAPEEIAQLTAGKTESAFAAETKPENKTEKTETAKYSSALLSLGKAVNKVWEQGLSADVDEEALTAAIHKMLWESLPVANRENVVLTYTPEA